MLGGTATADTEVRAAWRTPSGRLDEEPGDAREVESTPAGRDPDLGALAGQRALDKDHLAVGLARDAATFGVERLDVERQVFQSERNSPQWGRFCFSMNARRSESSASYCSRLSAQRIIWKRRKRRYVFAQSVSQ